MNSNKAPLPAPSGDARIAIKLTAADHVRLNVLRVQRQQTMQAFVREALNDWLRRAGESPLKELQS